MKIQRTSTSKRGFSLMELMVAMAITAIIVTVLVSITSIALDTWNRSRSEIRASRQAKSMIDAMAKDLECLVARRGNTNEWLSALSSSSLLGGLPGDKLLSTNASRLIFFSSVADRYNGEIGKAADLGGDVSCLAYQLEYNDAIKPSDADSKFKTFILRRVQKDPNLVFTKLLGLTSLAEVSNLDINGKKTIISDTLDKQFINNFKDDFFEFYDENDPTKNIAQNYVKNFACENVYQFSLTFNVQVDTAGVLTSVPVTVGQANATQTSKSFRLMGDGIVTEITDAALASQVKAGKVTSVQISLTVLSDFGVEQSKRRTFANDTAKADFLAKNSYQYAKLVQLPSM